MAQTLATLSSAPHRVLFLPGAVQVVLVMLYWLAVLLSSMGIEPAPPATAVSALAAHGWLMLYGIFPFFIFGFLFTAVPSWLDAPRPRRADYLAVALPMTLGALLFYPGLYLPALAASAIGLHLLGWAAALRVLWRMLNTTPHLPPSPAAVTPRLPGPMRVAQAVPVQPIDRRYAQAALLACALGALGEVAFLNWLLADAPVAWRLAESLAVWGFLAPVFLAVCHRMIPWFTSRVAQHYALIRPTGALWGMVAACLAHIALEAAELRAWLWLADGTLAALAWWLAIRWHSTDAYRVRLLAMLHIGFLWAGVAFTLYGIDSLTRLAGTSWNLGHAPLHALGIGFFASMLLAMASRVSLGHSGRKLEADNLTWTLFWLIQTTALLRLLPELLQLPHFGAWHFLAACGWLAAFLPWAWRYAPFYWRPRIDGRAG